LILTSLVVANPSSQKGESNKISFGTVFIMGIPISANSTSANIVLVTAAHVLDDIGGDVATLMVRRKNKDGTYTAYPFNIAIRSGERPLYVTHKTAAVADIEKLSPRSDKTGYHCFSRSWDSCFLEKTKELMSFWSMEL
jgi:hypothetical protein